MTRRSKGEFTGRHMLAIMVAFFGVIIAVNLTMAYMARKSWTGTVVDSIHIAGAEFNARAAEGRAQTALNWQADLGVEGGVFTYRLTDRDGAPVRGAAAEVHFRHPADDKADRHAVLTRQPDGAFSVPVDLRDGQWVVSVAVEVAALPQPYRDARRITLRDGVMQ